MLSPKVATSVSLGDKTTGILLTYAGCGSVMSYAKHCCSKKYHSEDSVNLNCSMILIKTSAVCYLWDIGSNKLQEIQEILFPLMLGPLIRLLVD